MKDLTDGIVYLSKQFDREHEQFDKIWRVNIYLYRSIYLANTHQNKTQQEANLKAKTAEKRKGLKLSGLKVVRGNATLYQDAYL